MAEKKKRMTKQELLKDKIPISGSNAISDKNSLIMLIEFTWGILTTIGISWWYIERLFTEKNWYDILILPLNIYGNIWLFVFITAALAWFVMLILKKIHPIQEGIFDLNTPEGQKELKYYKLRYWFAYYAIWLARGMPLPWVDFVVMKMMGSKIGKNVCLYDSWMDTELVEVGDHVMTSINTAIISHAIYENYFIQMRVVLEKNSITGAQSVIAPGTVIEEGAILGASSSTYIGQRLEGNMIHVGNPTNRTFPIRIGHKRLPEKKKMNRQERKEKRAQERLEKRESKKETKEQKKETKDLKKEHKQIKRESKDSKRKEATEAKQTKPKSANQEES